MLNVSVDMNAAKAAPNQRVPGASLAAHDGSTVILPPNPAGKRNGKGKGRGNPRVTKKARVDTVTEADLDEEDMSDTGEEEIMFLFKLERSIAFPCPYVEKVPRGQTFYFSLLYNFSHGKIYCQCGGGSGRVQSRALKLSVCVTQNKYCEKCCDNHKMLFRTSCCNNPRAATSRGGAIRA